MNFPLYEELNKINLDVKEYSGQKISDAVQFLSINEQYKQILEAIHLIVLHYYFLNKTTTTWGSKKIVLPYQGRTFDNKGIIYQLDNLPEEVRHNIYKLLKIVIEKF